MPIKGPRGARHHRSGPKHKHTKSYLQTYWPYIPMLFVLLFGLFFGGSKPFYQKSDVLAYATDVSNGGLLSATNTQRANNGVAGLTLNQQLINAAQAKANDMVARNYWSHNTPDGQPPWIFIQNAGYAYVKAGENLAYGFATSSDTVTGWMNSPPHRANLLDGAFKDVGFGIANSGNFVGSGPETVVVAMYGQPQVLAQSTPAPPASTPPATTKPTAPAPTTAPTPISTPAPSAPTPTTIPASIKKAKAEPIASDKPSVVATSQPVSRLQTISGRQLPWAVFTLGMLSSLAILALLLRHSLVLKRVLRGGERLVLQHPVFDTAMVSMVVLAYVLSSTSGFIH